MVKVMLWLSIVSMLLSSCGLRQEKNDIQPIEMHVWEESAISKEAMIVLPEEKSCVFTSSSNDIEVFLYCDETRMYNETTDNEYTYLIVNGQEFVLDTFEQPFYLRESVPPRIIWYDWNHDGAEDFVLWSENDRAGYLQYAFASTTGCQYRNIGSISWNEDSGLCTYQNFLYKVTLLDDYKMKIELNSADIADTYDITNSKFLEYCAIPLGMYDKEGKVTETGKNWDFIEEGLYEKEINFSIGEDGALNMNVVSLIGSGYSTVDLGCGFGFNWKLSEKGYELRSIEPYHEF